jgi:uncharacterized NAD-dependent epimerase/dehydratase family protein
LQEKATRKSSAVVAAGTGKAVGKDAAFQVLGKRLAHIGLGAAVVALAVELAGAGQIKPGLVMLGHRLVEQRALGGAGCRAWAWRWLA